MRISAQTKSFVILVVIAVVGTYLSARLYNEMKEENGNQKIIYKQGQKQEQNIIKKVEASAKVDISQWPLYQNKVYNFSFKYNPNWKVLSTKAFDNYDLIEIDPGPRFYNIKIYISKDGYAAMNGLPTEPVLVNGVLAQNVSELLYGFDQDGYYYTFDNGLSVSLADDFNALVSTVIFSQ
ncbi:MAG: hypothetical protein COT92_03215 [Candidatus Doudnabacteria bacterium CG10_big_fil_rev_8_21_14_0_10_42_18]|uniref:DUF4367 domain-containing protein n=1 Tax=Candidatus Doudnabacteria bacterium CG10_big_fil_rev_8_21_14_0_10_42_18 TaxID=1974552 RepID=A0A2H0VAC6_9BACT|nr:MAG: hypothetical protein COT92_03215 [Candidatus Doudnabacteria bacterium CG10_big_fil_rev_8_21_14_0_10_42_18]